MDCETSRPDQLSDATIWLLAVRDERDRTAFAKLFDHFSPRLKAMLMKTGLNSGAAEDVLQDVMLSVWRKASQFDPHRAEASAWIYRIARNRRIDLARREGRPVPDEIANEPEAQSDAGMILALDQEARRLREALGNLAPEQSAIIEKAYLGELTHREISTETGLPLGTIKSRIRLGLERLRHELKDLR
ncbi:sigma-70 family RNA polymerase sigma factor [Amaricoccus macauensis]|uniref:sigma-70 family RNA polymerase sigma factor n=1 Tax=Amaricoccus macauensis TaxID=57001 RepID=UPI003C7DACB0